jgi:hypothetical protein
MSDALPLAPRPNLDQYKKLAKDLQRACKPGDAGAVRAWASELIDRLARLQKTEITEDTREGLDRAAQRIEQRWTKFIRSSHVRGRRASIDRRCFTTSRRTASRISVRRRLRTSSRSRASSSRLAPT